MTCISVLYGFMQIVHINEKRIIILSVTCLYFQEIKLKSRNRFCRSQQLKSSTLVCVLNSASLLLLLSTAYAKSNGTCHCKI